MRIMINPVDCKAHGLCAELLPERISLDEWGYPLVDGRPLPAELENLARRAARVCPTLALKLAADGMAELSVAGADLGRSVRSRSLGPDAELRYQQHRDR